MKSFIILTLFVSSSLSAIDPHASGNSQYDFPPEESTTHLDYKKSRYHKHSKKCRKHHEKHKNDCICD